MAFPIGFVTFKVAETNDDTKKPSVVTAEDKFLSLEMHEKGDIMGMRFYLYFLVRC